MVPRTAPSLKALQFLERSLGKEVQGSEIEMPKYLETFSQLSSAVIRVPEGLGSRSGPVAVMRRWEDGLLLAPAAPFPGEARLSAGLALPSASTQGGAEEHAVKGIINDLLIGKQSS